MQLVKASNQTQITCFSFSLIGIPQEKDVLETHKSSSPGLMNVLIISFLRDSGIKNLGFSSKNFINLSTYLPVLKKYASSSAVCTGLPQSGQMWSGPACVSVQNASHSLQYQPLYLPKQISSLASILEKMSCTTLTCLS